MRYLLTVLLLLAPMTANAFCTFANDDGEVEQAWIFLDHQKDGTYLAYWECQFTPADHVRKLATTKLAPKSSVAVVDLEPMRASIFSATDPTIDVLEACEGEAATTTPTNPKFALGNKQATRSEKLEGVGVAKLEAVYGASITAPVEAGATALGFTSTLKKLPTIPLRAAQSEATRFFVFVRGPGRFEPGNYANGFIPNNGKLKAAALDHANDVYGALMRASTIHQHKTIVTSFAWDFDGQTLTRMRFDAHPATYNKDLILVGASPITGGNDVRDMKGDRFRGANSATQNTYRTRLIIEKENKASSCWKAVKQEPLVDGKNAANLADFIAEPFPQLYLTPTPALLPTPADNVPSRDSDDFRPTPAPSTPSSGCSIPWGAPTLAPFVAIILLFVRLRFRI